MAINGMNQQISQLENILIEIYKKIWYNNIMNRDKEKEFLCNYNRIMREKRTGMEWKKAVSDTSSQHKMFIWRGFAMLEYIRHMIEEGKLGNEIIDVIYNYEDWLLDEVDD